MFDIKNLDIDVDITSNVFFKNELELPVYRNEARKGKRVKANGKWKQVAQNMNFKLCQIVGVREIGSYIKFCQEDFYDYDNHKEYCLIGYIDDEKKYKEYIVCKPYNELKRIDNLRHEILDKCQIVFDTYKEKIKEEIRRKIELILTKNEF